MISVRIISLHVAKAHDISLFFLTELLNFSHDSSFLFLSPRRKKKRKQINKIERTDPMFYVELANRGAAEFNRDLPNLGRNRGVARSTTARWRARRYAARYADGVTWLAWRHGDWLAIRHLNRRAVARFPRRWGPGGLNETRRAASCREYPVGTVARRGYGRSLFSFFFFTNAVASSPRLFSWTAWEVRRKRNSAHRSPNTRESLRRPVTWTARRWSAQSARSVGIGRIYGGGGGQRGRPTVTR